MYFEEEKIRRFIAAVKERFAHAELVFDAMTSPALAFATHFVRKTGNKNAVMHFSVNHPETFGAACGMRLLEQRPFFTEARKLLKKELSLPTRIAMKLADESCLRSFILRYALWRKKRLTWTGARPEHQPAAGFVQPVHDEGIRPAGLSNASSQRSS